MPVDRELAMRTLKEDDPDAFSLYQQLDTPETSHSFGRLVRYVSLLRTLDRLESKGLVEIQNDYDSGEVKVRQKYKGEKDWRPLSLKSRNQEDVEER